jgi:serine phosphatase RsbU (regulator of sigma subunit)
MAHHSLYPQASATCLYGLLAEHDDGRWRLDFSSAGHPPPLLITHDGDTRYLTGGHGLLLGLDPDEVRPDATEVLAARSTVLLYTDGLIERRGESLDTGMTRLRQHAAALAREPLDAFCDELLTDHADDVALLAARLPASL